jgi:hypothetical protein
VFLVLLWVECMHCPWALLRNEVSTLFGIIFLFWYSDCLELVVCAAHLVLIVSLGRQQLSQIWQWSNMVWYTDICCMALEWNLTVKYNPSFLSPQTYLLPGIKSFFWLTSYLLFLNNRLPKSSIWTLEFPLISWTFPLAVLGSKNTFLSLLNHLKLDFDEN